MGVWENSQNVIEGNGRSQNLAELHGMGIFLEQENTGKFQKDGLDGLGRSQKVLEVDRRFQKASEGLQIPIQHVGKLLHSHMYLV